MTIPLKNLLGSCSEKPAPYKGIFFWILFMDKHFSIFKRSMLQVLLELFKTKGIHFSLFHWSDRDFYQQKLSKSVFKVSVDTDNYIQYITQQQKSLNDYTTHLYIWLTE